MYQEGNTSEYKLLYLNEILWHLKNNSALGDDYTLDFDLYAKFIHFLF